MMDDVVFVKFKAQRIVRGLAVPTFTAAVLDAGDVVMNMSIFCFEHGFPAAFGGGRTKCSITFFIFSIRGEFVGRFVLRLSAQYVCHLLDLDGRDYSP